ncbi:MAG: HAMP domain-containing histidine kinase [Acidimicrobiia bacterium]|nr:HAMP domain-containing histidine kinase [Acidimicrobiia bacterium]
MSLRRRLILAAVAAAALASIAVALFAYNATNSELRKNIDETLQERARQLTLLRDRRAPGAPARLPPPALGAAGGYAQIITDTGEVRASIGTGGPLPISNAARAVAAEERDGFFSETEINGTEIRVLTVPFGRGSALQIARPLDEVDAVLGDLRWLLLAAAGVGVIVAAGLAFLAARATLRPVHRLTETVEDVTATRDLSRRVDVELLGDDELERLATSFNAMLAALDESLTAQRRLVADASHELRTPITSLRTNIEVLAREGELSADDRERLRRDIDGQLVELSALVGGVIDLARGEEPVEHVASVRLDEVVSEAVENAEFHWPAVQFETRLTPATVTGVPDRIGLAVTNLLDNAGKWSPEGATVEVTVAGSEVSVRDHGPGVDPADVPFVFDRFWRAPAARSLPGSGLGLAIVRQVAEAHGGRATVEAAEGGGARFRVSFAPG